MATLSDVLIEEIEIVRRSWGWFLVLGILLIALGIICVGTAKMATPIAVVVLGWLLAVSGIVWLVGALQSLTTRGFFMYLLNAILAAVAGYLLIRYSSTGVTVVTMILAILFIVGGLYRMVASSVIQFPKWGWTFFAGICSLALGILVLVYWTTASTFFIGLVIGIDLIVDGAALIGFASAIHSLPKVATPKTA